MIVDVKTDELVSCICGFKPDHYSIGYGRTPYSVWCPTCKKSTSFAKCRVTGMPNHMIDYWNSHISKLTLEEMRDEVIKLEEERKKEDPYREYKVYDYYWTKDEGEKLYASCHYN